MAAARKWNWSHDVIAHSDAPDLKQDVFKDDAKSVAHSLKLSADDSNSGRNAQ